VKFQLDLVYNIFMPEPINISNNQEIDQALKEFEVKNASQAGEATEASKTSSVSPKDVEGVKFEIPSYGAIRYYKETDTPKIVKLTMKWSGVKEQKQAEYILLGFVVVAILVSGFLFFGGGSSGAKPLTKNQIEQIIKNQQDEQTP
jgi:hypothetical protein